ncbi:MAG TPA: ferrochelatase [Gemmatimonadales bacterium]|nr:ferrochelatase [Gemmatimonadales bacterium]
MLFLNMGGPATLDEVEPFLSELFGDSHLMRLPLQRWTGPLLVRRRLAKVRAEYAAIGGGSPIRQIGEAQASAVAERLDRILPRMAPFRGYVGFRYAAPRTDTALERMAADGISRVVAFSQYPQWSCPTSGSSFIDLAGALDRTGLGDRFAWSVIDRWHDHDSLVATLAAAARDALDLIPPDRREAAPILFTAHSIPMYAVDRGDDYPREVRDTMAAVMRRLAVPNPARLAWQSAVGPLKWLSPDVPSSIGDLAAAGARDIVVVPLVFTTDHIETLGELDRQYATLARELGITGFHRACAPNLAEGFLDGLAALVARHLATGERVPRSYRHRCTGCREPRCRPRFGTASTP